jgi:ribose transport system substrate-binding protein
LISRSAPAVALSVACLVVAVGCGSGETTGSSSEPSKPASGGSAVTSLPADVQKAYEDFDGPTGASSFADFKPKSGPPWTIGYASSYAGNTWRAGSLNQLEKVLVPAYQKAGLVDKLVVTQSNLKDAVQIQQMRQLISQGADIILLCCPSTALNSVAKFAESRGVPVVTFSGHLTTEGSVNLYGNYARGGYDMATWMAEQMGDKGNLLYVNGIPGQASNDSVDKGVRKALAEHPNIKVIGTVSGQWTDQIAKTEVLKFLGTHPQQIDGIITQSAQENGVLQAVLQAGRKLPPMTIGGEKGAACYWLKHPEWKTRVFNIWPPGSEATGAMSVMTRILQGQGPKIQSITRTLSETEMGLEDVKKALPADCDVNDPTWIEPPGWFSEDYLNGFFARPKAPLGRDVEVPQ